MILRSAASGTAILLLTLHLSFQAGDGAALSSTAPSTPPAAQSIAHLSLAGLSSCGHEEREPLGLEEEVLLSLVGHYAHATLPLELHVEFMEGALRVVVPAQAAAYPLHAVEPKRFCLEGSATPASLEFILGEERARVILTQGTGTIELVRHGW